ncbi:sulfatase-like hydrolase/transferase [Peristeroidobacter agariperforans]|uniref:sulfatase-like hydrolase/transferase n=1 Tax=Peristeroidobacter agariperforans TaxID=268404 RepID=UPI00101B7712|nr:sulfatase-like hydrolase/transferase [Peristeroidobacter agariperforans]
MTRLLHVAAALAGLWLLNALVTFHNVWPTVFIRPSSELSIELAGILLLMAAWMQLGGRIPGRVLAGLAVLFVIGALGRYAEVTAPALYGREVNLYWDLPHLSSVAAMLTRVASPGLLVAGLLAIIAALALLYFLALWSWRGVNGALQLPATRSVVALAAAGVIIGFTFENLAAQRPAIPRFSMPIAKTYGEQFAKVGAAMLERGTVRQLPSSPVLSSTLSRIQGSDVLIVFVESYGRVVYDNRGIFETLAPARAELARAIDETGRAVVSGYVESPTFGGGSWLAHLSFLTGIEMRDASRAQLLMTQSRRSFGHAMAEHGYRRVGLMPGLKMPWPEGVFYDFDRIYDDAALDYRGPAFGWWRIPDQFSLAALTQLELTVRTGAPNDRKPAFIFFPTVTTHTPFRPTPPYQADWSRMLSTDPFDEPSLRNSLSQLPEWNNLSPSYTDAVAYELQTFAGYLRTQPRNDLIVVIVGDHQPPAMVSGANASWDVPVHVISSNRALLDVLGKCGFVSGLTPAPETLGRMHQLGPALLQTFGTSASRCPMEYQEPRS